MKLKIPYDSFKFLRWVDPKKDHCIIIDEYATLIDHVSKKDNYPSNDVYSTATAVLADLGIKTGYIKGIYYDKRRHEWRSYFKYLEQDKEVTHLIYKEDYE